MATESVCEVLGTPIAWPATIDRTAETDPGIIPVGGFSVNDGEYCDASILETVTVSIPVTVVVDGPASSDYQITSTLAGSTSQAVWVDTLGGTVNAAGQLSGSTSGTLVFEIGALAGQNPSALAALAVGLTTASGSTVTYGQPTVTADLNNELCPPPTEGTPKSGLVDLCLPTVTVVDCGGTPSDVEALPTKVEGVVDVRVCKDCVREWVPVFQCVTGDYPGVGVGGRDIVDGEQVIANLLKDCDDDGSILGVTYLDPTDPSFVLPSDLAVGACPNPATVTPRGCIQDVDGVRWETFETDAGSVFYVNVDGTAGVPAGDPSTWGSCCECVKIDNVEHLTDLYCVDGVNGVNGARWADAGNAADHGPTGTMFTDWSTHINGAPDESVVIADFNVADNDFPATVLVSERGSQELYWAWVEITEPTILRDNNGNTGEWLKIFLAGCGQEPVAVSEAGPTGAGNVGAGEFATLNPGIYQIAVQVSDFSVYGGFNLQESTDGGGTFTNFDPARLYTAPPSVTCNKVIIDSDGNVLDAVTRELVDTAGCQWCPIECNTIPEDPLPDVEFIVVDGCDDVDGDPANFVTVTRETVFVNGENTTTFWTDYGAPTQTEYTIQGAFVDCATGEPITEQPVVPQCDDVEIVQAYAPAGTPGVNVERWTTNAVGGLTSTALPSDAFSEPVDYSSMPAHVNGAPDVTAIEADYFIADRVNAQDQFRAWGYLYIPEATRIRDRAAWADATEYFVGECGGPVESVAVAPYPNLSNEFDIALPAGVHYIGVELYDFSAYSGVDLQYQRADGTWARIPTEWWYAEQPTLAQCPVKACFLGGVLQGLTDLVTGEILGPEYSTCKPDLCSPIASSGGVVNVVSTIEGCVDDGAGGTAPAFWHVLSDGTYDGPILPGDVLPGFVQGDCC